MAYNTKEIITDKDGNPISQYYNPTTDKYEPVEGMYGANKVLSVNGSGNPILSQMLGKITDIADNIGGGGGSISYTIAAPDSINKERADLILTGDNDAQAINDAFTMLDNARGNDSSIAVRIDFMGGNIVLDDEQILLEYDNFHIYGNGVRIQGGLGGGILLRIENCSLYDTTIINVSTVNYSNGIESRNSTLINCTGISGKFGRGILPQNSTLINCYGEGEFYGIRAINNSTLINCHGHVKYAGGFAGIEAVDSTLIRCTGTLLSTIAKEITIEGASVALCCTAANNGFRVKGNPKPDTLELFQALNRGDVTWEVD